MNVRARFRQVATRIDALSLRERGLVMLGTFMVLFLLWDGLLMADLAAQSMALNTEIETIQDRMGRLSQSIATAAESRSVDPNAALQARLAENRRAIADLDDALGARAGRIIPPHAMAGALEEVLRRQGRLALVSARSLPRKALFQPAGGEPADAPAAVYRHGLEMEVEGRYLDVLEYLRALESLKWQFFWETVALESTAYPANRVRIRVYSLNFEEGWLGV